MRDTELTCRELVDLVAEDLDGALSEDDLRPTVRATLLGVFRDWEHR
ncbi:MAG: hypothetical protein IT306_03820 [Chloroflexi bacterium]|nr:hypothetical protein [Chloroflexota bacterium]